MIEIEGGIYVEKSTGTFSNVNPSMGNCLEPL